ncbi:hypothetical protein FRC03_004197 [Tulasnella sp. 419]|nr:hypothetical protein FRC03_004197 [Tulasnella sp. 419]
MLITYKYSADRAIFFGSGSVGEELMLEISATKAGNAMLGGISSVSPSVIAYVTTLVRFALSSDSNMTSGDRSCESFYIGGTSTASLMPHLQSIKVRTAQ